MRQHGVAIVADGEQYRAVCSCEGLRGRPVDDAAVAAEQARQHLAYHAEVAALLGFGDDDGER